MLSEKLQTLFMILRTNAEEMLDEIAATVAEIEEEEELVRQGVLLISNICSVDEELARKIIAADAHAKNCGAEVRECVKVETNKFLPTLERNHEQPPNGGSSGEGVNLLTLVNRWYGEQAKQWDDT